jgi:hypothetical protein
MTQEGSVTGVLKAACTLILQHAARNDPTECVGYGWNQACRKNLRQQALPSTWRNRTDNVCEPSPTQDFFADVR